MIIIDIWGGELSQCHLARFIRPVSEALRIAKCNLERGFLVNLRRELAWVDFEEFDNRNKLQ